MKTRKPTANSRQSRDKNKKSSEKKAFDFNKQEKKSSSFKKKDLDEPRGFRTERKRTKNKFSDSPETPSRSSIRKSSTKESPHKKAIEQIPVYENATMRLNKYIANAGICSRREADELIAAGVVSVNGKVITQMGFKISPSDEVRYNERVIRREKMVYVLLNKPKDYITTTDDPLERKTVMNLVQGACKERIYPVGRLDRATTGILVLTNDGDLTKKLTHPSYKVRKIYHVELDRGLKKPDFDKIVDGIELEDGKAIVDGMSYVGEGHDKTQIGIELHSGKNRIVRRIFEALDYTVRRLDRVSFAGLTKKDLPRGRWRFLTDAELNMLKMLSGK